MGKGGGELLAQHLHRLVEGNNDPDCRKIDRLQGAIAAGVDALEGLQIHGHIEREAVVCAVPAHLDAQRGDLAQAGEVGIGRGRTRLALLRPLRQHGMAAGVVQPDVNAWRTRHAVTRHAKPAEGANHRLLDPVHILFHVVARPLQVNQRIRHHLARPVIRHLPTPIGLHHRNTPRGQQMVFPPGQALCEDWWVFAHPQLVRCVGVPCGGEVLHGLVGWGVFDKPQVA